jgi:hypothetical protein
LQAQFSVLLQIPSSTQIGGLPHWSFDALHEGEESFTQQTPLVQPASFGQLLHVSPVSILPLPQREEEETEEERTEELLVGRHSIHGNVLILTQVLGPEGSLEQNRTPSGPGTLSLSRAHAFVGHSNRVMELAEERLLERDEL